MPIEILLTPEQEAVIDELAQTYIMEAQKAGKVITMEHTDSFAAMIGDLNLDLEALGERRTRRELLKEAHRLRIPDIEIYVARLRAVPLTKQSQQIDTWHTEGDIGLAEVEYLRKRFNI